MAAEKDDVLRFAKRLERELGIRCSVIDSGPEFENRPFPTRFAVAYAPGSGRGGGMFHKIKDIELEFPLMSVSLLEVSNPRGIVSSLMSNPRKLLNPMFPFRLFLFGSELYGGLREEFVRRLDNVMGGDAVKKLRDETQRIDRRIDREIAADEKVYDERRKVQTVLLNEYEKERLLDEIPKLIEKIRENKVNTIVGVDRSGRPLALLLNLAWRAMYPNEEPLNIYFMSPHKLSPVLPELITALKEKSPNLYRQVKKDASRILVVEDMVYSGGGLQGIGKLFKAIGGRDPHLYAYANFSQEGIPSWWFHKDALGVTLDKEKAQIISRRAGKGKVDMEKARFLRAGLKKLAEEMGRKKRAEEEMSLKKKAEERRKANQRHLPRR